MKQAWDLGVSLCEKQGAGPLLYSGWCCFGPVQIWLRNTFFFFWFFCLGKTQLSEAGVLWTFLSSTGKSQAQASSQQPLFSFLPSAFLTMAQQIKYLPCKHDDPSLIFRTQSGRRTDFWKLSTGFYMWAVAWQHSDTLIIHTQWQ